MTFCRNCHRPRTEWLPLVLKAGIWGLSLPARFSRPQTVLLFQSEPIGTMSDKTISGTSRLPELDGLRPIALLLVLFSHHLAAIPIASIRYVVEMGWVGVDLFFVLS